MPLAEYTTAIIAQLRDTGVAAVRVDRGITPQVARARLYNAARRTGLRITTTYLPLEKLVLGEVTTGDPATIAPTPAEALARRGYYVKEANGVCRVWWLVNDDPEDFRGVMVGDWPTTAAARKELERYHWPRSSAALRIAKGGRK